MQMWHIPQHVQCWNSLSWPSARFKQVESCIAAGEVPSFHRCEPVDDNLMESCQPKQRTFLTVLYARFAGRTPTILPTPQHQEWEVEMSFPADSALQKSLENLAAPLRQNATNSLVGGIAQASAIEMAAA